MNAGPAKSEQPDTGLLIEHLTQIEGLAESILADKQKLINLDRQRNKTREAIRILQKDKSSEKKWVCYGNMFIKMEKRKVSRLLDKDFDEIEKEMASTRSELKPKMSQLRDMEHEEDIQGFNLQPLSADELNSLKDLL
ncbi:hypothetical protein C0Q70_00703 [Pomacea canaliculata]|uniref:Uncharacterized protein n=2 Tax=Pomacea canaliculata TaxID=400727 RepID=A0A2T7PXE1_POMCA|nr:hypothetical protein C0Q70_00703 [Pomacea canaliculata]